MIRRRRHFLKRPEAVFRRFGRIVLYVLFVGVSSYGIYLAIVWGFAIRHIKTEGAPVNVTVDESRFASNLLFFPEERYRKDLLSTYTQLADVEFIREFPSTLIIRFVLRKPAAMLTTRSRTVFVDETGIVLETANPATTGLPLIAIPSEDVPDGAPVVSTVIRQALAFIAVSRNGSFSVGQVTSPSSDHLRCSVGGTDVLIPLEGDYAKLYGTLQSLLIGFRMKGSMPVAVDLRFSKPTVQF